MDTLTIDFVFYIDIIVRIFTVDNDFDIFTRDPCDTFVGIISLAFTSDLVDDFFHAGDFAGSAGTGSALVLAIASRKRRWSRRRSRVYCGRCGRRVDGRL